ncbi:MAG: RNA-guided endonuclease InsQ/TnpB family protein [Ktedonobacterales bacterium]
MDTETVRKTFKYKLTPTPAQEQTLAFVVRRCCELYNAALQERRDAWQKCRVSITAASQSAQLPAIKEVRPEYRDIHSQILQDVLTRLDRAFQAFFRRIRSGEAPGYPRFQGVNRYTSFTYKQFGNGAAVDNGFLMLSKIGRIGVRWSRPLEGTPKTVTISQEADGWYVCISCAEVPTQPLPLTGRETGIDVGLKVFLINSDGEATENPRHHRKAEKQLKKAQRRVSRRKQGSKRRKKAVALLKRKHQKVQRQRRDFHHKTARSLLQQYDTIYLEDLRVANMIRNHHLAKSISDAGWYAFRTILEGKAVYAGRRVVAVPPAYTSQDCSGCGTRIPKSLSVRTHVCTSCGLILDRDENAARNIQWAGQALRGLAGLPAGMNRASPAL